MINIQSKNTIFKSLFIIKSKKWQKVQKTSYQTHDYLSHLTLLRDVL